MLRRGDDLCRCNIELVSSRRRAFTRLFMILGQHKELLIVYDKLLEVSNRYFT